MQEAREASSGVGVQAGQLRCLMLVLLSPTKLIGFPVSEIAITEELWTMLKEPDFTPQAGSCANCRVLAQ